VVKRLLIHPVLGDAKIKIILPSHDDDQQAYENGLEA
jgi:hypothetical protein